MLFQNLTLRVGRRVRLYDICEPRVTRSEGVLINHLHITAGYASDNQLVVNKASDHGVRRHVVTVAQEAAK